MAVGHNLILLDYPSAAVGFRSNPASAVTKNSLRSNDTTYVTIEILKKLYEDCLSGKCGISLTMTAGIMQLLP